MKRENPLKSVEWLDSNLDVGIYREAEQSGKTVSMLLEEAKSSKQGEPTVYHGMSKPEIVKAKAAFRAAGQIAPMTAFEELLQASQIDVKYGRDSVSKFFEYSGTDVLFPELISDRVYAGEMQASIVPQFTFSQTTVTSNTFKKLYLSDDEDDRDLVEISKLEDLPETRIETSDQVVRLRMYGRYLARSKYDDGMSIAAFNRFMERVGMQIGIRKSDLLIYRLINGDGNTGTTPGTTVTASAGAGSIEFSDCIEFAAGAPAPYKVNVAAFRKAGWTTWINRLYDGTTTSIGSDVFNAFPTPVEWDRSGVLTANYAIGVDSRYAIEEISTGAPVVDAEKVVRRVADGFAIHTMYEFPIADNNAVVLFNFNS